MPVEQLSGVTVVIIIAVCVEWFIVLFIFAKRQITRFALRNKRGPHTHLGQGAPKQLRKEADRRLDYVPYIKHEPPTSRLIADEALKYRSLTASDYAAFETELARLHPNYARLPGTDVRAFLLKCQRQAVQGPLRDAEPRDVHLVCDLYSHARHHFEPYGQQQYRLFKATLERLWKGIGESKAASDKADAAKELNKKATSSNTSRSGLDNSGFADFKESSTVLLINNDNNKCSSTAV